MNLVGECMYIMIITKSRLDVKRLLCIMYNVLKKSRSEIS